MKRYSNLYTKIYDIENIKLANKNAQKGKSKYSEVKLVNENPEKYILEIHNILKNKTFKNSEYEVFKRLDRGKEREIFKLPYFPDRIIHHCIMQVLEPIWMKIFIQDTYASMKHRGIHAGVKRMKLFLKDKTNTQYCLKLDIKKFYPSIDHDILKKIVRKKIKCKDTLWILDEIIDSAKGLPIGNYLSQFLSNLYLAYFDHWIKEEKSIKYYSRYCDDIIVLHNSKEFLHVLLKDIKYYLETNLNLTVKHNWQIFPTKIRGIDFLGYRFFGKYTLIRKSISKEFLFKVKNLNSKEILTKSNVCSLMSYFGWIIHGNGYNLLKRFKMKKFSDFATEEIPLIGDKVKLEDVLGKEVIITGYRISNSKFKDRDHGKCITIQFIMNDIQKIFFTGSEVLMNQIEKYKKEMPFSTVVLKHQKYYTFS
jgi:RNA-directed DNA polymerase